MKKQFDAVGVYVSAGGPTLGIKKHLNVVGHLTDGKFAYDTRAHNFPKIREYPEPSEWPDGRVDFVYCAPPCAPFSSLGNRGNDWQNDPKVKKAYQSLELGLAMKPRIWMMESVTNFYKKADEFIDLAEQQWLDAGYQVTHFFTGGILHGVPQRRMRWHMFASRLKLVFPEYLGEQTCTMVEAFDRYGPPQQDKGQVGNPARIDLLQRYAPDGCKYRDVYTHLTGIQDSEVGLYAGVPHFSLRRGRWNASVPTLVGTPRVYMPKPARRLYSVGEGLVMCGYPSSFEIVGKSVRDSYDQIARGILPPLADYLGRIAKETLEQGIRVRKPGEAEVVDFTGEARTLARRDPRIPKMPEKLFGIHKEWLVRKRDK